MSNDKVAATFHGGDVTAVLRAHLRAEFAHTAIVGLTRNQGLALCDEVDRLTETLDRVRAWADDLPKYSARRGAAIRKHLLEVINGPAPADPDERAGDGR